MDPNLYETNFYSSTTRQAEVLSSEGSALESQYNVLCTDLLKALYQTDKTSFSWKQSVVESRLQIAKVLRRNPGLRSKRDALFSDAYQDARKHAELQTGLPISTFPEAPRFDRERAESEGCLPDRLAWTRERLDARVEDRQGKITEK